MIHALVAGGGGYKGRFQWEVIQTLPEPNNKFDVAFGTSTGALNAFLYSQGLDLIGKDMWKRVEEGLRFHKGGIQNIAMMLFGRLSLYTNNLQPEIEKVIGSFKIPYFCTVVDWKTKELFYVRINDYALPTYEATFFDRNMEEKYTFVVSKKEAAALVTASTAIPFSFDPIEFRNFTLYDGGVREIIPLRAAIKYGATHITAIVCSPEKMKPTSKPPKNVIDVVIGTTNIMSNEISHGDMALLRAKNKLSQLGDSRYRELQFRYIAPDFELFSDSLNPSKQELAMAALHGKLKGQVSTTWMT